jgi:cyanophycinase
VPNGGLLVLNGGDEFKRGNELQDGELVAHAGVGPAYVVPTAAARQGPDQAVANARRWFGNVGLEVKELPILKRADARSADVLAMAVEAGLFYLVGGDPGLVASILRGSDAWTAIVRAWSGGAALAGSSAGAMALCEATLVRHTYPGHRRRRPVPALGLVPRTAVLPHYDTFGQRWIESAREAAPELILLGLDERTAAVWDGDWRALGSGAVTVIVDGEPHRFESGSRIEGLPDPAPPEAG